MFDDDIFLTSVNKAKWNIYVISLQDLTFYTLSYLHVFHNYQEKGKGLYEEVVILFLFYLKSFNFFKLLNNILFPQIDIVADEALNLSSKNELSIFLNSWIKNYILDQWNR